MFLLSQIIQIIALLVTLVVYQFKTKKGILKGMMLTYALESVHFLLLNAYSGFVTKVITLIRNGFITSKEKNKKLGNIIFLYLFLFLYILMAVITYDNIYSLLPYSATIIYLLVAWNGDEYSVKKVAYFCYLIWVLYNITINSPAGVLTNTVALISTYIACVNENKNIFSKIKNKIKRRKNEQREVNSYGRGL